MKLNEVLSQFLLDCEIRGRTGHTLKWYAQRLGLFIRVMLQEYGVSELEEVKIGHLRQFVQLLLGTKAWANSLHVATQERNLSPITVRGYVRAVKRFFRWCVDEELLSSSPASRLAQPKAPAYLTPAFTPEHIERMLGRCDLSTPLGFRDYVLLLLLLDTGMRVSELCNLKVSDVHDRYVKVFGKGRKEREIGIHPEVSKLLWKYIHKYRRPSDPDEQALFIGRGQPLHIIGVQDIIKRI